MRILVYGAGVLGCELAHVLMQNKKNVVTLLARGEWKEMIDQKGLVIRHWVQRKTTTERIKTVDTLAPDDYYDLVFVVVQAGQLPDVLPVLKANKSQYFVFVGNNPQAKQVLEFMQRPADKIAFGFQGTAGRREHDHVVSVYASAGMTVGGATTPLSGTFRTRLKTAFDGAKYKLTFYGDMDEWLKCHIAFVLPACYVCYACNGDLHRATKQQRGAILDAAKAALEAKVKSLAQQPRWKPTCDALKCLKGIDAVTAASIACEADGFARFATASGFAAWVGLVPSEHSSGESRFRGGITKAGNKHLRKLLVEAAWHYKGASRSPKDLAKGQAVDAATRRHANAGVRRLVDRRRSMDDAGKQSSVANVAVARELACWCWAVGRMAEGA